MQLARVSTNQVDLEGLLQEGLVEAPVEDLVAHPQEGLEEDLVDTKVLQMLLEVLWRKLYPVFLGMTTQYLPRFLKPPSCVMVK